MTAEFFIGAPIVTRLPGINQPELPSTGNGYIYFDISSGKLRASNNGAPYQDIVLGSGGGGDLQDAYDNGAAIVLGPGGPVTLSKAAVDATSALVVTVTGGSGAAIQRTGFDQYGGIAAPPNSAAGTARIYYDSGTNKLRASENGGAYVDLVGGSSSLQGAYDGGNTILLAGALPVSITNPAASATAVLTLTQGTAGQNAITATGGDVSLTGGSFVTGTTTLADGTLSRSAALAVAAVGAAVDLTLTARSASTNLNQAGQTALNVAFTGAGRTSIIGALNSLVDGTVPVNTPTLSSVLAAGNTTGANNVSVNTGQKILGAAELTLDGTTVLNLQTGATTRWQVSAAGHLLPGATDNSEDIGASAVNRIRTLYAGTSVVVGSTVTINGTTNTISSSANLTLDTAAAGTLNLGNTNATTIVVGTGASAITAAGDVTVSGNLTVNGTTTTVNSTNLTVTDPLIYANNGGLDPSFAGIAWDQGAALDVITVWNPTNSRIEFGRFNTVGGTVLPAGALATLTDIRANNVTLAGTTVTADAGLTVTATAATLSLVATGANLIQFTTNGAARWNVDGNGHLLANTDNTVDIGAVGATRPRRVYVGTEVVVGNTITIGSSTIASSTTLNVTSASGTGGGAGSFLAVSAGAGDGAGAGGSLTLSGGAGGGTGAGNSATLSGGAGGGTSGNGGSAIVMGGSVTSGQGGAVTISGANGGTAGAGGGVQITSGNGATVGAAGDVSVTAGSGGTTSAGGNVTVQAGTGGSTNGNGGATTFGAGAATGTGTGGTLTLNGGTSPTGTGGSLVIQTGNAALATRVTVQPDGFTRFGTGTATSTVHVNGSLATKTTSISGNTTADATTAIYLCDATGGAITFTLPLASTCVDRIYTIKKTDTSGNAVNVTASGGDLIDGSATQPVSFAYESISIVSDGTNWWII